MADFTDKAAFGTSRMNPSSMVPGSSSNAPQGGFATQRRTQAPAAKPSQNQMQQLAAQLQPRPQPKAPRVQIPAQQSALPASMQAMLPAQSAPEQKKSRTFKQDDFNLLASVFKTLAEQ